MDRKDVSIWNQFESQRILAYDLLFNDFGVNHQVQVELQSYKFLSVLEKYLGIIVYFAANTSCK